MTMVGPDLELRMAMAWRELRRGPATMAVRDALFGTGPDAVEATHMDVLDHLAEHGACRMSELAVALKVDPSTVTRTLQRMEADDLAARSQSSGDGRVVTVTMTDEGRRRHTLVSQLRHDLIGGVLAAFSEDERAQLVELNERFVSALDAMVERLGTPLAGRDLD